MQCFYHSHFINSTLVFHEMLHLKTQCLVRFALVSQANHQEKGLENRILRTVGYLILIKNVTMYFINQVPNSKPSLSKYYYDPTNNIQSVSKLPLSILRYGIPVILSIGR